eukprot:CAMPEP_0174955194 /NCGR_PEP_ID=MMETSP0004_2-20121128/848_1 /TAXON_ID=420556 /ORGANISM="Ochromonas sp., Strain CCMP1393" /LENGTH=50 /DNA_ID=CAMNT_0016203099 /DNA_START=339 /DNA_END=491 /DNA_ORIENTATION=+
MKKMGQVSVGIEGPDDDRTLNDCNFTIGDYLDIAVSSHKRHRTVLLAQDD